jgi:hypothetical protein
MGVKVEGYIAPELDSNSDRIVYDFQLAVAEYNTDPDSFEVASFLESVPEPLQLTALISLAEMQLEEEWPIYHVQAVKKLIKKMAEGKKVTFTI